MGTWRLGVRGIWGLTVLLAFIALVLWLNYQERDHYETGSLAPVDGSVEAAQDLERFLSIRHDGHEHALDVVEQRRELTLRDRDGWYRVFWAGDEVYHYKELVHLASDYQNPSAAEPAGRWTIRVRAAAAPCGTSPYEDTRTYVLRVSEDLPEDALPPDRLPDSMPGIVYRCRAKHLPPVLRFAWTLAKIAPATSN